MDAIKDLTVALAVIGKALQEQAPAAHRLEVLERQHFEFEAMCEGLLLKAEGKLRSATNAEARTRADKKSYEHLLDPLAEIGDEPEASARDPHSANNDPPGEAERLLALRVDVAANPKALAQRAKFGVR